MQYVGQTGRSLKTRFREHFRKMKKPKKFDTFLYRHFKNNGHPPSKIVIQPVEKIICDPNSSTRLLCRATRLIIQYYLYTQYYRVIQPKTMSK